MNLDDLEETIRRLTKEKFEIIDKHNQQILLKSMKIQELTDLTNLLEKQNQRLGYRLDDYEDSFVDFTQRINRLLSLQTLDQSIDDRQIIEDFKRLENGHKSRNISVLSKSHRSISQFASQNFQVDPLETAMSNLQKGWEILVSKLHSNDDSDRLNRYFKQQITTMQEDQRVLRTQYKSLQNIHNQSQKSRHEISDKMKREIEIALRNANQDLDKMPLIDLKQKVGIYARGIQQQNQKILRLQQELYNTKSQYTQKLQLIKHQSAKIKQKSESDMFMRGKEQNNLKSSNNRK